MAIFKLYISRFIVVLVALQILNLGLYAQDFTVIQKCNGADLNIINSVTEYVAEIVMKKANAFPEKKEKPNQSEHESIYKFQPFKIYASNTNQVIDQISVEHLIYSRFIVNVYINHTADITAPPPKLNLLSGNMMS